MQSFETSELDIADDSARHAGHAGAAPEGETHFNVKIVSPDFKDMSRLAMHRAVTDALADEFETGLHALSIRASAISE